MSAPVRVLHVTAPAEAGGLERVVQLLAAGQRARGADVTVAAVVPTGRAEHPFLAGLRDLGVEAIPLEAPPRGYRHESAAVASLCRDLAPDVVHTHGYRPDVVAAGAARSAGVPLVSTVHGFTGGGWRNALYERLQVWSLGRFEAVVAVSRPLGRELAARGVRSDRIHVIPNAWAGGPRVERAAARSAMGVAEDVFHVGWVGRLSREKGADVLLEALPFLHDLPLAVSMVGLGPEAPVLRRRALRLGVEGRLRWHGLVPDAHRLFAAFDVLVISSRTEGTPMVLFEAVSAGVPVVATRVGGIPDVVPRGEALLVEPEDPAGLARAIREVRRHPEVARGRATRAGERLKTVYALEPWLRAYDRLYRRVSPRV